MIQKLIFAVLCILGLASNAQAFTITDLGPSAMVPDENEFQIDFSPITFVVTEDNSEAFGFLVKEYYLTDAFRTGFNVSGDFIVSINGNTTIYNGTEATRGPLGDSGSIFTQRDLHIGVGAGPEQFPVSEGDIVVIRANNLRFTSPIPLPELAPFPWDAFMIANVDGDVAQISDTVQLVPGPAGGSPRAVPTGGLLWLAPTGVLLLAYGVWLIASLNRRKTEFR